MVYSDMRFYTFKEFCENADYIKMHFLSLDERDKYTYKLYIYSNHIIKEFLLDKIWEYLNEPIGSCYYVTLDMLEFHLH